MKIAVICANGRAGRYITNEAVSRGLDVTGFARSANTTDATKFVQTDLMDLTRESLEGFDVVIDAYGAWTPEGLAAHCTTQAHLCDLLSGTNARLLVVGGAGSLFMDESHTTTLADTPDFPESYKPVASACAKALEELRKRDDVRWTYLCPAADFRPDGARVGKYLLGGEEFKVNGKGESVISYADYAVAMIDEAITGGHVRERISVVGE